MMKGFDCVKCKGRLWCGKSNCRVLEKYSRFKKISERVKGKEFVGSSPPGLFVSWNNYPKIFIAPLTASEIVRNAKLFDFPEKWFGFSAEKIIEFRESLIAGRKKINAFDAVNPSYDLIEIQEMVMALDSATAEVKLKSIPLAKLNFDSFTAPIGPIAELKNFSLMENPKIPKKVDYLVSDTEINSITALTELYNAGIPVSSLYKLLSAGLLGKKKARKFVPTRWAITAVDSNLSIELLNEIKFFPQLQEFQLFESHYLDNHFFILLIPSAWSFEQLEAWQPGTPWTENETQPKIIADHEFFNGRKNYANNVTGAYYAARLAIAEHLMKIKRQAAVIVFREIGKNYSIPLGVWQIRENVRNALKQKPIVFFELSLALAFLEKKLSIPLRFWRKESKLLDFLEKQKKLTDF